MLSGPLRWSGAPMPSGTIVRGQSWLRSTETRSFTYQFTKNSTSCWAVRFASNLNSGNSCWVCVNFKLKSCCSSDFPSKFPSNSATGSGSEGHTERLLFTFGPNRVDKRIIHSNLCFTDNFAINSASARQCLVWLNSSESSRRSLECAGPISNSIS